MDSGRRPFALWPVGLIGVGATLLLLITANGYDYHRDELYFRLLGQSPQWGYVDQPPLTPLLARLGIEMFGDTVWALRVPAAVLLGLTAVLAAMVAREDRALEQAGGRRTLLDRVAAPANRLAVRIFLTESRRRVWANTQHLHAARLAGAEVYERRVADLSEASAARVADLLRPGPVLLRLAVRGFGVRLPDAA